MLSMYARVEYSATIFRKTTVSLSLCASRIVKNIWVNMYVCMHVCTYIGRLNTGLSIDRL